MNLWKAAFLRTAEGWRIRRLHVDNAWFENGEPLARMVPIRRRRAVPEEEVLSIFATAPVVDVDELRADLDEAVSQDMHDPYAGTGL